jgi:Bacteriophage baseplate protein W
LGGMNRETGKYLDGYDHLKQSIADILTTPLLTRVFRRDYGSTATYLVDKPGEARTLLDFTISLGQAIDKWEPRYRLEQCWFDQAGDDGVFSVGMNGIYYPNALEGDFSTGVSLGVMLPLPKGFLVTGAIF